MLGPAIRLAEGGFPASRELSEAWTAHAAQLLARASSPPMFPDGRPPRVGERIGRPYLAGSLRSVADSRDAFYLDRVGSAIPEATGNLITRDDLSRCQARWVTPLRAELFGRTAWTTPPQQPGIPDPDHPGDLRAAGHHRGPGASRLLARPDRGVPFHGWERDHLLYDPDTGPDLDMLDPGKLAERTNRIDPAAAGSWRRPVPAAGGTAYMCAVDRDGMGVSLIQSNFYGIGSGLSAGRTGVWLHNRGAGFNLIPGHPNEWKPGRRPLHTLSPPSGPKGTGWRSSWVPEVAISSPNCWPRWAPTCTMPASNRASPRQFPAGPSRTSTPPHPPSRSRAGRTPG